ncbi:PEGA domain-containing protein [Marinobacter sp. BW6]|uniref:MORN repeat-containing protein n=1 Tax=Marinobacter sp. BW6 TaxID=2592624 RepID=UPI0011DE8788|nr:PEGA domain-containing protein [Marinobacter sp. BW6]TYC58191.1 PEGA domain-containing protein [Marinobacter sp. BW6]
MVDFRPLLFVNALALMLLVTAGFASVRDDLEITETFEAPAIEQVVASGPDEPETSAAPEPAPTPSAKAESPDPDSRSPAVDTTPFTVPPMPKNPKVLAVAEPPAAMATRTVTAPTTQEEPAKQPKSQQPTQALLVLRSNVVGDQVTINGKEYGATRLDLELDPGRYDVTISKPGFKPWNRTVALEAGNEMTLVGRLAAITTVNFHDGNWIGGVKTGDGTYQDADGLRYEGHFVDGKFHGQGTAWYPDGSRYEGDWSAGKREGEAEWRSADGSRYSGEFRADQFNGKGTLTLANGDILTGHWQDGQLNGHGSLTTADGMLYVGGFRNDEFHGSGTLTYPDGRHYEGEFSNGAFHGTGAEVFASGKKYEGQYIEGKFHGKGLLKNPNGSSIEATFRHGEPYGQVRLTTAAGEIFTARTTEPGVCYRDKSYRATECPKLEGW